MIRDDSDYIRQLTAEITVHKSSCPDACVNLMVAALMRVCDWSHAEIVARAKTLFGDTEKLSAYLNSIEEERP